MSTGFTPAHLDTVILEGELKPAIDLLIWAGFNRDEILVFVKEAGAFLADRLLLRELNSTDEYAAAWARAELARHGFNPDTGFTTLATLTRDETYWCEVEGKLEYCYGDYAVVVPNDKWAHATHELRDALKYEELADRAAARRAVV